jgi:hypothetical protein
MTNTAEVQKGAIANALTVGAAWAAVGVPLLWGVVQTLFKAAALFR